MASLPGLRHVLKRGALVTAANWQVVLIQFIAESTFKLLLAVPILGGVLLVAAVLGSDVDEILVGDAREVVSTIAAALVSHPAALIAFLLAFGLVLLGGSGLMFLIKAGTVSALATGERVAGAVERPPLRVAALRRAAQFGVESFIGACLLLFRRYLRLGLLLLVVYALSAAAYLLFVFAGYRFAGSFGLMLGWTIVSAFAAGALLVWITLVNLAYLLVQMVIAVEDVGVRAAARRVVVFVRAALPEVAAVFGIVLALVVVATIISILATAGLGLIAFVPLVGLAAFPLQAAAWLARGLVFQYLGLTALGAYLTLYRAHAEGAASYA